MTPKHRIKRLIQYTTGETGFCNPGARLPMSGTICTESAVRPHPARLHRALVPLQHHRSSSPCYYAAPAPLMCSLECRDTNTCHKTSDCLR